MPVFFTFLHFGNTLDVIKIVLSHHLPKFKKKHSLRIDDELRGRGCVRNLFAHYIQNYADRSVGLFKFLISSRSFVRRAPVLLRWFFLLLLLFYFRL